MWVEHPRDWCRHPVARVHRALDRPLPTRTRRRADATASPAGGAVAGSGRRRPATTRRRRRADTRRRQRAPRRRRRRRRAPPKGRPPSARQLLARRANVVFAHSQTRIHDALDERVAAADRPHNCPLATAADGARCASSRDSASSDARRTSRRPPVARVARTHDAGDARGRRERWRQRRSTSHKAQT